MTDLGERLRALRHSRGLTLGDVAQDTGFTSSYLSQIETGGTTPSLTALAVIAASLGSEVAAFFPEEPETDVRITRAGDPDRFSIEPNAREEYVLLNGRVHGGDFTALIARHLPGAPLLSFRHLGEEHALVLDGELRVEVDGELHHLQAGDWIHYASDAAHGAEVVSDGPAQVLWVLQPGIF